MSHHASRSLGPVVAALLAGCSGSVIAPFHAHAQTVEDGSDAAIGKPDTKTILALVKGNLERGNEAKISALRRSTGSLVCGTVNVKGNQDLYLGERGFVADLAARTLDRVPEGVELLNPRAAGFEEKEKVRQLYFDKCLD